MAASSLRWLAVALLLATGVIHVVYGAYYLEGTSSTGGYGNTVSSGGGSFSTIFYIMGAVYLVGAVLLAINVRPRLFQTLALAYTVTLLAVWALAGARESIAYVDKAIEVILAINLIMLITRKAVKATPPMTQPATPPLSS